ncbi:hypothetical protein L7F22_045854 [Adiantum nelumboides]|nr:hypothetical protein [Adiantum nelumboides]
MVMMYSMQHVMRPPAIEHSRASKRADGCFDVTGTVQLLLGRARDEQDRTLDEKLCFRCTLTCSGYSAGCECYNLYDQCIPYMDAWTWQKALVKKKTEAIQQGQDVDDALIILQHNPVYTLGTRSSEEYLLFDKDQPPCDLYRTERGGEVTYHGPGQLVIYPILNLRNFQMDLHWYLRSLEEVVIRALWNACGIKATRIKGLTGVWVGTEKIAAIGVRVSRWVTYHGLALNVTTNLSPFKNIVPCGISNFSVGSVGEILQKRAHSQMFPEHSSICLDQTDELLGLLHKILLDEFSEVFGLNLSLVSQDASIFTTGFGT